MQGAEAVEIPLVAAAAGYAGFGPGAGRGQGTSTARGGLPLPDGYGVDAQGIAIK